MMKILVWPFGSVVLTRTVPSVLKGYPIGVGITLKSLQSTVHVSANAGSRSPAAKIKANARISLRIMPSPLPTAQAPFLLSPILPAVGPRAIYWWTLDVNVRGNYPSAHWSLFQNLIVVEQHRGDFHLPQPQ